MKQASEETTRMIEEALGQLGLEKGDTVLVHSDATAVLTLSGFEWWGEALLLLKRCFLNVLGPAGTLVVPTFNYDFCKGKPYSHEETPSQVGLFTNHIRLDKSAVRSFHPIFSFAAIGEKARDLLSDVPPSSFGPGSVFDRLHRLNAKLLFFNVPFALSCTFIHYTEYRAAVPYRTLKQFKGEVTREGVRSEGTFDHYVRSLERDVHNDMTRLSEELLHSGKMDSLLLASTYPLFCVRCNDVYETILEKLRTDPHYLLKRAPLPHPVPQGKSG